MSGKEIDSSLIKFSVDLYEKILAEQGTNLQNTFLSPLSIYTACAMTMAGANEETLDEMLTALHVPQNLRGQDLHTHIGSHLMKHLSNSKDVELSSANRLFVLKDLNIIAEFLQTLDKNYSVVAENVGPMSSLDVIGQHINEWVSESTKGKITDLIPPGGISSDDQLLLINALYFKGSWKNEFPICRTSDSPFHCLDGTTFDVPLMFADENFPYQPLDELEAQAIKLPFLGEKWKMLIILPKQKNGLPALLNELHKPGKFADILDKPFNSCDVEVFLPRFKLSKLPPLDMKEILLKCGFRSLFNHSADLSNMCFGPKVFVSDVKHKAVLEVDEAGATAAAATAMNIMPMCACLTKPTVVVDHPFFIALLSDNNVPAFIGHVVRPEVN